MTWMPHLSIAQSLMSLRAAARSIGSTFRVLGQPVSDRRLREILVDTLGIPEEETRGSAIAEHISRTIHQPVDIPDELRETLGRATIATDDVLLARQMGVDPLRLLLLGHDATARVTEGAAIIRAIPLWNDRRLDRVDVSFTLGSGVTWRNGTLRCRRVRIPNAIADSLIGRTIDGIIDHGWEGWKSLRATGASQSGETLTVHTADQEHMPMLACGQG